MFSFFRRALRVWERSSTKPCRMGQKLACRLGCEVLEDRVVPSLTGIQTLVNSTHHGIQHQAVAASSANGSSVVVWTEVKAGPDRDVKAQRFNAAGHKVGGEILVAGGRNPQHDPAVAMDARGNFTIVWTHDYSPADSDIHAASFRADGKRAGKEITVAESPKREFDPSIGMSASGDFVVSYTYQFGSTDTDIKAVLYHSNRTVARTLRVADSTRKEERSSAAMAPDGRFAIAFVKSDDIVVQRHARGGNLQGTHAVAAGVNQQREPEAAMDKKGNVFVGWQENVHGNWNVYARTVLNSGQMRNTLTVQASLAQETAPSVAIDSSTGKAAVAYQSKSGSKRSVKVTGLSAAGRPISTLTVDSGLADPFVSLGRNALRFVVVAQSHGAKGGDPDGGIFARFGVL